MEWVAKINQLIERLRTPLALAGLVVLVLYGIYKQILEMDVFTRVGENETFVLLGNVFFYLFVLAIFSVILGGLGYFLSIRSNKQKR
ncbi:MAG: hypothetical protein CTY13_06000 [Methylobacter sp.]|nr:MAG: hypothetical protein CTY13_06000 [Methylobacter sp.]